MMEHIIVIHTESWDQGIPGIQLGTIWLDGLKGFFPNLRIHDSVIRAIRFFPRSQQILLEAAWGVASRLNRAAGGLDVSLSSPPRDCSKSSG